MGRTDENRWRLGKSISQAALGFISRHRKWVSDQIERYNDLETRKVGESETVTANRSHLNTGGSRMGTRQARNANPTREETQIIADAVSPKNGELETEIRYLKDRITFLEADIAERKEREAWLRGQVALPAPERNGWAARLRDWWRNA